MHLWVFQPALVGLLLFYSSVSISLQAELMQATSVVQSPQ